MTARSKRLAPVLVLFGGALILVGTMSPALTRHAGAQDQAGPERAGPSAGDNDERKADRAAIDAQMQAFLKAFEGGDAERVASFWTAGGELIEDDGSTHRGRAAIAKVYREMFGGKEKRRAEIRRESLRFPSKDTAIEEGRFTVRVGEAEPTSSRYSVLHVREGGKWLMAVVRESPAEGASLSDLEWLVGTWVARRDDAEVRTTYEWVWNKTFLRMRFTIRQKDQTVSGFQMIGRDAESGELRSWTFESEGGFGEATLSRDGKRWVIASTGRMPDGSTMTATNLLVPLGPDSFTWQSVKRSVDGEEVGDIPPVKVTRVKEKK